MSFPLRLTADISLAWVGRALLNRRASSPILQVSPDSVFDPVSDSLTAKGERDGDDPLAPEVRVPRSRSRMIWIGEPEPLGFRGVARLVNSLAASGCHVFLETSGATLKHRLHEFIPSSHLYLAVRLDTTRAALRQSGNPELSGGVALEALRMARLAGFYTCARLVLRQEMQAVELEKLNAEIQSLDVDGFLINAAPGMSRELEKYIQQVRRPFLDRPCAMLSSFLDAGGPLAPPRVSRETAHQPIPKSQPDRLGESAEAR
jgi:hypothetical protein